MPFFVYKYVNYYLYKFDFVKTSMKKMGRKKPPRIGGARRLWIGKGIHSLMKVYGKRDAAFPKEQGAAAQTTEERGTAQGRQRTKQSTAGLKG